MILQWCHNATAMEVRVQSFKVYYVQKNIIVVVNAVLALEHIRIKILQCHEHLNSKDKVLQF